MAVAIVGMGFRLPGASDPDALWQILAEGRDLVRPLAPQRLQLTKNGESWPPGGYLQDVAGFDASFFNINGREACLMDPQQRLLLMAAWEALERGGFPASGLAGQPVGVFVGAHTCDYGELALSEGTEISAWWNSGVNASILANRLSFFFDFTGPSITLNTACSSGLEAVTQACNAITSGQCLMALAGGTNLVLTDTVTVSAQRSGMISPEGACRTFDGKADGFVRGEGIVVLVLKDLAKAEEDGDPILAIIRGSASGHGGRASSLTAPHPDRQRDVIQIAWERSGIDPSTAGYLETHGTGTKLGDAIETLALSEVFKGGSESVDCGLGSIKTQLGHAESAAGLAGILKVCLAMKHRRLPANLHFQSLSPLIELKDDRLFPLVEETPWKTPAGIPRRAGVSSFGFGGSYAHVVMEEASQKTRSAQELSEAWILLSAKNESQLLRTASNLLQWLNSNQDVVAETGLQALAFALQMGREWFSERLAFLARDMGEVKTILKAFLERPGLPGPWTRGAISVGRKSKQTLVLQPEGKGSPGLKKPVGEMWVLGHDIDFGPVYTRRPPHLELPTYPFMEKPYWFDKLS